LLQCVRPIGVQTCQSIVHRRYFPKHLQSWSNHFIIEKPGANTSDLANYRPITNLNTISKILESLAKNQEHLHLSPNLNTLQSAYRSLHSTEMAMTKVVNDLLMATDSGKPFIPLSLDISVAFDMPDDTRLLQRATELFGLDDNVINWLKFYLTGRTSYVSFRNFRSSTVCCTTGVLQSSVLGALLCSIFTSPVGHLISSFNISYHQYADDTQLCTSVDPSSSTDITRLSSCVEAVIKWHLENCQGNQYLKD
jgi:Reverse transcriptase (RNA-dependent DNA polymerase)